MRCTKLLIKNCNFLLHFGSILVHKHTPSVKQASGSMDSSGSNSTDSAPSPGGRISTVLPSEELRTVSIGSFCTAEHHHTQESKHTREISVHPMAPTRPDCFYCYCQSHAVQIIQKYLQARGFKHWFDWFDWFSNLQPGMKTNVSGVTL